MTLRKKTPWVGMLLVGLLFALPVRADNGANKARARALFIKANRQLDRGIYIEALKNYRKARAIFPSPKIDLNIGGCLDSMGRRAEAATYLEKFLVESEEAPRAVIKAARKRLGELRRKLGRVQISCMEEGATIILDDKIAARTPMEIPLYARPGFHALKVIKEGFKPYRKRLRVRAGRQLKLAVVLASVHGPAKAPPRTRVDDEPAPDPGEMYRRKTMLARGTLGIGLALTATAVVFYAMGGIQGSAAHDEYRAAQTDAAIEARWADVQSAENKLVAANVIMGVAAAALGMSLYCYLTRPAVEEKAATTTISVTPRSGGALLGLTGRF